ncbi:hypothetical protein [Desulfopila aestuarii]|uniref:hypothetical protein n=1 Tax=Desulfopila aestuarii TaxID=231440 RepID=UPI001F22781A|nr:hypothetical protein [Desulfopila aestuarii]
MESPKCGHFGLLQKPASRFSTRTSRGSNIAALVAPMLFAKASRREIFSLDGAAWEEESASLFIGRCWQKVDFGNMPYVVKPGVHHCFYWKHNKRFKPKHSASSDGNM